MAGRQRQPVPVTRPAHPLSSAWSPARLTPIRARHAADEDAPGRTLDLESKGRSSPTLHHEALGAVNNTYAYTAGPVLQLAGRMS